MKCIFKIDEVPEDWEKWGDWVDQADGSAKRTRVCKNKGVKAKCRGKSVQIRKLVKKPQDSEDECNWFPQIFKFNNINY